MPIMSYTTSFTDNRFYQAEDLKNTITELTNHEIVDTIVGAEPI
jgi:hypothetical protein